MESSIFTFLLLQMQLPTFADAQALPKIVKNMNPGAAPVVDHRLWNNNGAIGVWTTVLICTTESR